MTGKMDSEIEPNVSFIARDFYECVPKHLKLAIIREG